MILVLLFVLASLPHNVLFGRSAVFLLGFFFGAPPTASWTSDLLSSVKLQRSPFTPTFSPPVLQSRYVLKLCTCGVCPMVFLFVVFLFLFFSPFKMYICFVFCCDVVVHVSFRPNGWIYISTSIVYDQTKCRYKKANTWTLGCYQSLNFLFCLKECVDGLIHCTCQTKLRKKRKSCEAK